MLHLLKLGVGWFCAALLVGLIVINSVYMLVAPRRWMKTEKWYFGQGNLRYRSRYSSGEGDWELRFTGAIMLVVICCCVFGALSH
jgi:hypothetical protein